MASDASDLRVLQRMAGIERRLARLEELFHLKALPPELLSVHESSVEQHIAQASIEAPPVATAVPIASNVRVEAQRFESMTASRVPRADVPLPRGAEAKESRGGLNIESLIGGRFFAVLGALGLMIGLALFLKLAYDEGWLGRIAPMWRCLAGGAVGVGLLFTGEAVRRRLGAWASAGISAAGLAGLYASGYAAFAVFELIGAWAAFSLLAVTSGIGVVIGARSRMPALSVLSFLGAYLVPFLLKVDPSNPFTRPAYLMALLTGGMALASWLRGGFRVVGTLVFVATMLLGAWAVQATMDAYPSVAVAFVAGVWSIVHAALLFATRENAPTADAAGTLVPPAFWRTGVLLGSFIATGWSVGLSIIVLRSSTTVTDWLAPMGGVAATSMMAIALCGHLRLFMERPSTEREYLGAALLTQAGGLFIGVVAMAASGSTQLYLWLGLGVAAAVAGKWTGSKAVCVYALVLLSIATLRLGTIDALLVKRMVTSDLFGLMLTRWSMHCVMTAAAWMVAALSPIRRTNAKGISLTPVASVIALVLLMVCVLHPNTQMGSIAVWWAVLALGLAAIVRRAPTLVLVLASVVLALAATLLGVRALISTPAPVTQLAGIGLSVWSAQAVFVGLVWLVLAVVAPSRHAVMPIVGAAMALLLAAVSVLHPSSDAANIVIVWTIAGGLAIGLSRLLPRLSLGSAGSVLVVAALVPWTRVYIPWVGGDWHGIHAPLGLHPGLWRAALIGAVLAWSYRRGRRESMDAASARNSIGMVCLAGAGLLAWCASSFEVARAARSLAENQQTQLAAVSIWWGLLGVALIVFGFARTVPFARHVGLGLMGLAAVKVVVHDLSSVPAMWRVVSFLLLGLLMLGVALVYARLNTQAAKRPSTATEV